MQNEKVLRSADTAQRTYNRDTPGRALMYYCPMKLTGFILEWRLLHLVIIWLLAGCASSALQPVDQIFTERAQETLNAGITLISEKYIEHISTTDLALEGLRSLDNIDPDFIVEIEKGTLTVYSRGLARREYLLPVANNADTWSSLMAVILQYARTGNTPIATASEEKIFEAVFDGSVSLLDSFSRYAGAKKASENRAKRSGFGGIGVEIGYEDKGARIVDIFPSTPADVAGLQVNDLITHLDSLPMAGLGLNKSQKALRGEIGSLARLTVERNGASTVKFSLKRERILLPTVKLDHKNGILQATVISFNNETARQLATRIRSALTDAETPATGMILDLRGNPGGLLTQAVMVADLFLVSGKILSTRGRHPSSRHEYVARGNDILNSLPLVVLINGKSASASEIVAAALQDQRRAIVVGTASFGKGTVQSVSRLPNDGELILTWSRFVTPSGYILHDLGVPPTICVGGAEETSDGTIAQTLQKISEVGKVMNSWHEAEVFDKKARGILRATCPANPQKRAIDILIAKTLIKNPELYRRIVGISPSIASVVK